MANGETTNGETTVDVDEGGPAFPCVPSIAQDPYDGHGGMMLRDYFAGQALIGLVALGEVDGQADGDGDAEAAAWSYRIADRMLAARRIPATRYEPGG